MITNVKGYLSVLGGILIHLVLGTEYLWGNIKLYTTSYYRLGENPDLSISSSSLVFPFWFLF